MTIEKQTGDERNSPGGAPPPSAERNTSELLRENEMLKERVARLEESEAALKETESQFREAQRIARLGNWERDVRTGRIRASDEFWRIFFNRVPEESGQVYTAVLGRIHPEDRDAVRSIVAKAPKNGKTFNLEFRVIPREGTERTLYARGEVVFNEAGEPVKVRGIAQDITRRKRADEENQRLLQELGERVKELTALRGASRLLQDGWTDIPSLLLELASLLPPAFRWPEVTAARVRLGRADAATPGFADSPSALRSDFLTADGQPGSIEVVSTKVCEQAAANLFTVEQQALVETVADMLRTAYDRQQAESALRDSNELLRQLTENIREVFWVRTPEADKVLYVSHMYENIWGRTCQSLYEDPQSFIEAVHPEDLDRVINTIAGYPEGGYEMDYRIVTPGGEVRWLHVRTFPVRDVSGRVYRLAGIAEDVTERKRVEEAVRESEARFRAFFEKTATGNAIADLQGRILESNRAMREMLGYSGDELSRMRFMDFSHPDSAGGELNLIQELLRGDRNSYQVEKPCFSKAGDLICVRVTVSLIRDAGGNPLYLCGSAEDVTKRKQMEEELRTRERQLADAQRLACVGSWSLDLQTQSRTWSEEFYRILGVDPREPVPTLEEFITRYVHPDDRERVRTTVEHFFRTHEPYSYYRRLIRTDGEVRVVHSRGSVVYDEKGNAVRLVGASQDVTEQKLAEEHLRKTTEQLRALSASLHSAREEEAARIAREIHDELGAALSSLRWDLEEIEEVISRTESGSAIGNLRRKIEAMMRLTDATVNTVRRIASELRPAALDNLGLVEAIEWQAQQFTERTGIVVRCNCYLENLDLSQEQSTALFRIFQEALTNILRHAQACRVDVALKEDAGCLVMTICDDGRGITKEEISGQSTLGLLGMRERAALIGAEFDVCGVEGEKTVVTVRVPTSSM